MGIYLFFTSLGICEHLFHHTPLVGSTKVDEQLKLRVQLEAQVDSLPGQQLSERERVELTELE